MQPPVVLEPAQREALANCLLVHVGQEEAAGQLLQMAEFLVEHSARRKPAELIRARRFAAAALPVLVDISEREAAELARVIGNRSMYERLHQGNPSVFETYSRRLADAQGRADFAAKQRTSAAKLAALVVMDHVDELQPYEVRG